MGKKSKKSTTKHLNHDQLIALINIYEEDWKHRDLLLWSHVYRFFYISVLTMLIPQLSSYFSLNLGNVPRIIFPVTGTLLSLLSIYVSYSMGMRLKASDKSRRKLYALLPDEYHKVTLKEISNSRILSTRVTIIVPFALHILVILLGIFLILLEI
ncbi:MAG: hypothetical protein HDR11_15815 [Lachnospiraceae bacterium]|nr:hypothetical protein [Lachnospiraceae bacterium]